MKHEVSSKCATLAVLTVSDTRSIDNDQSGDLVVQLLTEAGHTVSTREVVQDEQQSISDVVARWARDVSIDAIVVTGGTGPSVRDVTPNAIEPLLASTLPGFGELFRQLSFQEIGAAAMFSRAGAGWIDAVQTRTPVFMLPGSPKAVRLALESLIVPQLGHLLDVCSLDPKQ